MDAKPKSNKLRRIEKKQRLAARAERRAELERAAGSSVVAQVAKAEKVLKETKSLRRDPERILELVQRGETTRIPLASDLGVIAELFQATKQAGGGGGVGPGGVRPRTEALRRLVRVCRDRTNLLDGQHARQFTDALLALSAHERDWIRPPEDFAPRSHNAYRQFHALARHLTAKYDVPTFLNTAWLEGLTAQGVAHQSWFLHVARGENLRTAPNLPVPLTKKQAHFYMQAPCDFDVVSAFRYAQITDLGGDERLVRSVVATRVGTSFAHDDFWLTVFRWLVAQPMLDPAHHGPVIDYLYHQRFVASVPDPNDPGPGVRRLVPPQPNLSMKGRSPETLLRALHDWHHRLGRERTEKDVVFNPSGFKAFCFEEGKGEGRKVYTITELLSSRELIDEGRAMGHCVASYVRSCASGRVSIWSLRLVDGFNQSQRLLTLEVARESRQVVQARRRFNHLPSPKELQVLRRWGEAGGPSLSKWVAG